MNTRFGWLVSYPKSGNTWVRLLLESLLNGGKKIDLAALELNAPIASRMEFDQLFGIDSSMLTDREIEAARPALYALAAGNFDGPLMLRKVHDRCWRTRTGERVFPPALSRGAVYIVRDPRDVAVSMAHYYGLSMDTAIERLNQRDYMIARLSCGFSPQLPQPLGDWSAHVTSWLDDSEMPVHLVRYEDLQLDTAAALRGIAAFLGLTCEHAELAVQAAQFETLREQEGQKGFAQKVPRCKQFFRAGRAGGWREALSAAQANRIESHHGEVMARLGFFRCK